MAGATSVRTVVMCSSPHERRNRPVRSKTRIGEGLQFLWDAGLELAHAVRDLAACAHIAAEELGAQVMIIGKPNQTAATAIVDLRRVAGTGSCSNSLTHNAPPGEP